MDSEIADVRTQTERLRLLKCPVRCERHEVEVRSLADFITTMSMPGQLWYRGHANMTWRLAPSALRYGTRELRERAIGLIAEFKRVGEIKLTRPPRWDEELKWVQLAQHYGVPTRLLDWTESPVVALYFACLSLDEDGVVFIVNPVDLNRASYPKHARVFNAQNDEATISRHLTDAGSARRKIKTIAISPVWNSDRLMMQKGAFTLHGSDIDLDDQQAPSLVAVPILREAKPRLQQELERIGIDEMTMFPELEHACGFLRRRAQLL